MVNLNFGEDRGDLFDISSKNSNPRKLASPEPRSSTLLDTPVYDDTKIIHSILLRRASAGSATSNYSPFGRNSSLDSKDMDRYTGTVANDDKLLEIE